MLVDLIGVAVFAAAVPVFGVAGFVGVDVGVNFGVLFVVLLGFGLGLFEI